MCGKAPLYISATSTKKVAKNLPKTYFYARCDEYAVEGRIAGLPWMPLLSFAPFVSFVVSDFAVGLAFGVELSAKG